jgi:predicted TIM-barrel fold metal-dependent hydrolase
LAHFVLAITQRFPERLVWGTDWPHATEANKPDDAAMLDWIDDLLPCQKVRASIFAENPARLYGWRFQIEAQQGV